MAYRFKSIDIIRGLSICWMIFGHLSEWWIKPEDFWYFELIRSIGDFLGSGTFLFISGVSSIISYRNRIEKANNSDVYTIKMANLEYIFRAIIILIIALILNTFTAIMYNDFSLIWNWFILQTISFSLLLGLPLLKTSKLVRILLSAVLWIFNQVFLFIILPFEGQVNFPGILFKIFYSNLELDPIFSFFTFFIIGTVIGDLVHETFEKDSSNDLRLYLTKKILVPSLIFGFMLVIFGISFQFPQFLHHRTFSWLIYSLGLDLIIFASLLSIEEKYFREKSSENFFYYFSYYSFTIYIAHDLLYFVFLESLSWYLIWIIIIGTIIIIGLILKLVYHSIGAKASLKFLISKITSYLTKKIA